MLSSKTSIPEHKHIYIEKLKEIYRLDENKNPLGNCLEDAQNVVHLLTGESIFGTKNDAFSVVPVEELSLKNDNRYAHPIVQDLFNNKPGHVIFYIEHDRNRHAYAIEKETYQGKVQYRVYQSWILKFVFLDWLEKRGQYPFTTDELKDFIQNVIHQIDEDQNPKKGLSFFCCRKKPRLEYNIRMIKFDFNKEALEKSYNIKLKKSINCMSI
jgi:hypothetical protein